MRVRFSARDDAWSDWAPALRAACPEMHLDRDGDPATFDAIIYAPGGDITDFAPYANVRLVLGGNFRRLLGDALEAGRRDRDLAEEHGAPRRRRRGVA